MDKETTQREFRFGEGKISGVLSAVLGLLALGAVLCFLFPSILTTPEVRVNLPLNLIRGLIQLCLVLAFILGVLSVVLSKKIKLGTVGIGSSVLATLLGGSQVKSGALVEDSMLLGLHSGQDRGRGRPGPAGRGIGLVEGEPAGRQQFQMG